MSKLRIPKPVRKIAYFGFTVFLCLVFLGTQQALAWTKEQIDLFKENITRFDSTSCSPAAGAAAPDNSEAAVSKIYMVGDSVMVGAYFLNDTPLKKDIAANGWTAQVDANGGRGMEYAGSDPRGGLPGATKSGLDAIKADMDAIKASDTVVIELGTNESNVDLSEQKSADIFKGQVIKAIDEVQSINKSANIYWVNISADVTEPYTPYVKAYNDVISSVADDKKINVIDTTKAGISLDSGGIHPDTAGYKKLSHVITSALGTTKTAQDASALSGGGCCPQGGGASVGGALVGKDNEEKTWNYFKAKGLSDEQTAGIMGNIQQESGFDPQVREIGGRSQDPNTSGGKGWGIIQWTPGSKVIGQAKEAGITEPIYLLKTQLDLVWEHMHNHPVVTQPFDLNYFKTLKSANEANAYFGEKIEGFEIAGARQEYTTELLSKYAGQGGDAATAPTDGGGGGGGCAAVDGSVSPDCTGAVGSVKILCEAKKYDVVSYVWGGGHAGGAAYHKACKTINTGEPCGLDCSGLVSVAVYDAFGAISPVAWDTNSLRADTKNWQAISQDKVQPGDVMEPDAGHVEIVDHISGGTVHTFGAHSSSYPQERQVGPSSYSTSDSLLYFRYIGKGSS